MERCLEFFKLDHVDKKVLFWMMDKSPESIEQWILERVQEYARRNIAIDAEKFIEEMEEELPGKIRASVSAR